MADKEIELSFTPNGLEKAATAARVGATVLLGALSEVSGAGVMDEAHKVHAIAERMTQPTVVEQIVEPEITIPRLTNKENKVLELVATGMTNNQIATALDVTEQTVKFHLGNIFRKLDVKNRTEASKFWHKGKAESSRDTSNQDSANTVAPELITVSDDPVERIRVAAACFAVSQSLLEGLVQKSIGS